MSMSAGSATPSEARMMWNPSVNAIWLRAAPRLEARVSVPAVPLGFDPDPARALMREARAGPVDDGLGAILVGGQQGEVDGAPGELGFLALDRLTAEHLHHGGAAADRRHRALVPVFEGLRLLTGHEVRDRLAGVLAGLQRDGAELRQDLRRLRIGDRGDVADREDLRMRGDPQLLVHGDAIAARELEAEGADQRVPLQSGAPDERVGRQDGPRLER